MKRLYLIRHGMTEPLKKRMYYGATDVPLLPEGIEDLKRLRQEGGYPDLDGKQLFSSGMLRAEQTLQCLYDDAEHGQLPEFREMSFGAFEMKTYEDLKDDPVYQAWIGTGNYFENQSPGGESGAIMAKRVGAALDLLLQEEKDTVLVCHGGTILVIMSLLFPGQKENLFHWQPPVGYGYEIDLEQKTYTMLPKPWPIKE